MSSFLTTKKKSRDLSFPEYLTSASMALKSIYTAYKELERELEDKIKSLQGELTIKKRTIVKSEVAKRANQCASNLRPDREISKKILDEIEATNRRLEVLYKDKLNTSKSGKHKSKEELDSELKNLKVELDKLKNEKYVEFFKQLIATQLTENQQMLAEKIKSLEIRNKELEKVNSNLRNQNAEYMRALNSTS